jgi:hypothetical protein
VDFDQGLVGAEDHQVDADPVITLPLKGLAQRGAKTGIET